MYMYTTFPKFIKLSTESTSKQVEVCKLSQKNFISFIH